MNNTGGINLGLQSILQEILSKWPPKELIKDNPLATNTFPKLFPDVIKSIIPKEYEYDVKSSAGIGKWAKVPWLMIYDPLITDTAKGGVYLAYLFKADGTGVYLSIIHGVTDKKNVELESFKSLTNKIREKVPELSEWGVNEINLGVKLSPLAKKYQKPGISISAKHYLANSLPSEDELKKDLLDALNLYEKIKPIWQADQKPLAEQKQDSKNSKLRKEKPMTIPLPKPFLLLAGISGTGKTHFVREQAALFLVPLRYTQDFLIKP